MTGLFHVIDALKNIYERDNLTVFEVGLGSGYLGAMLVANKCRNISIDNAQALYLWQNRLLASLAGENIPEWTNEQNETKMPGARVMRVPRWKYVRLYDHLPLNRSLRSHG